MKKPKFRVGQIVYQYSPYGYLIGKGKIVEIILMESKPVPFLRGEPIIKYYYRIPKLGLIAENILQKRK